MCSPKTTCTSLGDGAGAPHNLDKKPRLTEGEKKQNRNASEQKRREALREGFDRLAALVPGMKGKGRSEGLVLKHAVEFMRQQIGERRAMIDQIERAGGCVDDELRKPLSTTQTNTRSKE